MNVSSLINVLWPELVLVIAACILFLIGAVPRLSARRLAPVIATAVLVGLFFSLWYHGAGADGQGTQATSTDSQKTLIVGGFAYYIKMITAGLGILFALLAWPTNHQATGNSALDFANDGGEFFGLMLLSLAGVFLVAGANDIMLLFLGIELASIPTYIMVSISRPLPIAQEAGVKYFFLGAMAAALMLFGFSYLYGTTGQTKLDNIVQAITITAGGAGSLSTWQLLAVVMLLLGFAFKIAAVPLHTYAGDVYQGAATPVTAFLAFVPKASGFIAIIKILSIVLLALPQVPDVLFNLLWVLAILTMIFGNALAVTSQYNIKRVLAYSSVAHSGYMLAALTAMLAARGIVDPSNPGHGMQVADLALMGVLFYLCAYGIMNTGAFGVLMMLPSRTDANARLAANGQPLPTAGSAETFDDIAGQGRQYPALGLAMMICCLSLTGIPLTIGFLGKVLIVKPIWAATANAHYSSMLWWLVVILVINAAVSAGYYLKIVAYMYLRTDVPETDFDPRRQPGRMYASVPVSIAIVLSVVGTLFYGIYIPGADALSRRAGQAASIFPHAGAEMTSQVQVSNRSGQ